MTRLQRATLPARILATIKRAAVTTVQDRVQVTIRVRLPVSRELLRRLRKAEFSKGAWEDWGHDMLTLSYVVKTNYTQDLPGFAREVLYSLRQARREGVRMQIVRFK